MKDLGGPMMVSIGSFSLSLNHLCLLWLPKIPLCTRAKVFPILARTGKNSHLGSINTPPECHATKIVKPKSITLLPPLASSTSYIVITRQAIVI